MKARIVFMGTPEFACPSLEALIENGYDVVGAFTQPDRPVGRGHKVRACPAKELAAHRGIEVFQFERVRRAEGVEALKNLRPDVMVTAAFGQILSREILEIPRCGTINVHASLLPRHRGAAPINWAILQGDAVTGVTTMLTDAGLDTGAMLLRRETAIGPEETAGELTERLSLLGAQVLIETLEGYLAGKISPVPQDEALASYEPMLKKEMGEIDWRRPAREIACQVRGLNPWPCAYSGDLKILRARESSQAAEDGAKPGQVLLSSAKQGLHIQCGEGALEVTELQAPGGKKMAARAYLAGRQIPVGTIL